MWYPHQQSQIESIEKVQHRATRLVPELQHLTSEERLRALSLPTLIFRRIRADAISTYKIIHGIDNVDHRDFFELRCNDKDARAHRGHDLQIVRTRCRRTTRQHSFVVRSAKLWNMLDANVVYACNSRGERCVNSFKKAFDAYMADKMNIFSDRPVRNVHDTTSVLGRYLFEYCV